MHTMNMLLVAAAIGCQSTPDAAPLEDPLPPPSVVEPVWSQPVFGFDPGRFGAADWNHPEGRRLVFAPTDRTFTNTHPLLMARWDGSIRIDALPSFNGEDRIGGIVAADIDDDGTEELVVMEAHRLSIFDPDNGDQPRQARIERLDAPRLAGVADVDGDGAVDIVLSGSRRQSAWVRVTDPWGNTSLDVPTDHFLVVVGELDGEPTSMEAITAEGMIIDLLTGAEEGRLPLLGVTSLHPVDVDGDGVHELVVADGRSVWLWSPLTGELLWTWRGPLAEYDEEPVVHSIDRDNDGQPEIVVGVGPRGDVYLLDGITGVRLTAGPSPIKPIDPQFRSVTGLAPWDHDGDGIQSLFRGSFGLIALLDAQTLATLDRTPVHHDLPVGPVAVDLNGDGVQSWALRSSEEGGELVVRSADHVIEWFGPDAATNGSGNVRDLRAGDVDGDGRDELLMRVDGSRQVERMGLLGGVLVDEGPIALPPGRSHVLWEATDLDGDGADDLVVKYTSGGTNHVAAISLDHGVLWIIDTDAYHLALADITGDGVKDLSLATDQGPTTLHDGTDGSLIDTVPESGDVALLLSRDQLLVVPDRGQDAVVLVERSGGVWARTQSAHVGVNFDDRIVFDRGRLWWAEDVAIYTWAPGESTLAVQIGGSIGDIAFLGDQAIVAGDEGAAAVPRRPLP